MAMKSISIDVHSEPPHAHIQPRSQIYPMIHIDIQYLYIQYKALPHQSGYMHTLHKLEHTNTHNIYLYNYIQAIRIIYI